MPARSSTRSACERPEDEGVAAADAVAETPAERWRFSGVRDSETGSGARDPCGAPRNAGVQGGTESSNLLCSSGESRANLTFAIWAVSVLHHRSAARRSVISAALSSGERRRDDPPTRRRSSPEGSKRSSPRHKGTLITGASSALALHGLRECHVVTARFWLDPRSGSMVPPL
jgi:hypothetical protein